MKCDLKIRMNSHKAHITVHLLKTIMAYEKYYGLLQGWFGQGMA